MSAWEIPVYVQTAIGIGLLIAIIWALRELKRLGKDE